MANRVADCQASESDKIPAEGLHDEPVIGDRIFTSNITMKRNRLQRRD